MNNRFFFSHWDHFKKIRVDILKGTISLIVVDLLVILLPWLVKAVIDRLDGETPSRWIPSSVVQLSTPLFILVICCLYLSINALIAFFRYWWRVYLIWSSFPVAHSTRMKLFHELHSFDREFFKKEKVGDLLSTLTTDTENIRLTISIGALMFIDATINFILFPFFMYQLNPQLTLYIIPALMLVTVAAFFFSHRAAPAYGEVQKLTGTLSSRTYEIFSAIRLIKAFRREDQIFERFKADGENLRQSSLRVALYESFFSPTLEGILGITLAFVLMYGGFQYFRSEIELSSLVAFQIYLAHLDWPMMAYGWFVQMWRKSSASSQRIQNFVNYRNPLLKSNLESYTNFGNQSDISFRNMSFSFSDGRPFMLGPINLNIPLGSWIGVSGPLGGGKSTFLELISRQRDPTQGDIFYGGKNLRSFGLKDLNAKIVYVPQEAFMFSRTVRSNLLLGGARLNDERLNDLLEDLVFDREFIKARGGLNARIGERGIDLSGGQKQRLSLGRALTMQKEVYLFDDIFSHVDIETEHRLLSVLKKYLPSDATVFLVSQRVQTLQFCDFNLILTNGRVEFFGKAEDGLKMSVFLKDIENLASRHSEGL